MRGETEEREKKKDGGVKEDWEGEGGRKGERERKRERKRETENRERGVRKMMCTPLC